MKEEIPRKIGILCSAGGTSFFSAMRILCESGAFSPEYFYMVVDRECGAEKEANRLGVPCMRISEADKQRFSAAAADRFLGAGCNYVIMLFSRLVTSELFHALPTLNIHPSLLPAFKGIGAVNKAHAAAARILGATLHLANDEMDGGPIIAQVSTPLLPAVGLEHMHRVSYMQKTYLTLCAVDLVDTGTLRLLPESRGYAWDKPCRMTASASPALPTAAYAGLFSEFQSGLGTEALLP